MDTLTQFTLGAAIGTVALGRRIGVRKAALTGGVLATLPDLDVYLPFDGPIDSFVEHRSWTHSLFVLSALSLPIGEALWRLARRGVAALTRTRATLAVWLALVTHPLLDWTTTYGTQIFWPIDKTPYALSSIFIIDPLYTLPLLIAALGALFLGARWARAVPAAGLALMVSTGYLGWTAASQQIGEAKVRQALAAEGVAAERVAMIPMPFNSLLWRGVALVDGDYINVYRSVFDGRESAPLHRHPRNLHLARALDGYPSPQRVERFSRGLYAYSRAGRDIRIADIRMGVTPQYVFTFKVGETDRVAGLDAETAEDSIRPVPVERVRFEQDYSGLNWLFRRILDEGAVRPE